MSSPIILRKPQTAITKSRPTPIRPLSNSGPRLRRKRKCKSALTVRTDGKISTFENTVRPTTSIDIATNDLRKCYSLQRIGLKTQGENQILKEKLTFFYTLSNKHQERNVVFSVTHQDMANKFEDFKSKINSLLSISLEIKDLTQNQPERDSLKAGLQKTYRIHAKGKQNPLKLHFEIINGTPNGHHLYISEHYQRPNKNNNDKDFLIKTNSSYFVYNSEVSNEKIFLSEYVYMTLEVTRDITFDIDHTFGKNAIFKRPESEEPKNKQIIHARTSKLTIDEQIKRIVSDRELLWDCRKQALDVMKRRREKYERLTGIGSFIEKNKTLALRIQSPRPGTVNSILNEKIRVMSARKDRTEEGRRMASFLYCHRWEINRRYDDLIEKAQKEKKRKMCAMSSWVGLMKMMRFGRYIMHGYYEVKKKSMWLESQMVLAIRLYILHTRNSKEISRDVKKRTACKLSMYFSILLSK